MTAAVSNRLKALTAAYRKDAPEEAKVTQATKRFVYLGTNSRVKSN